jgi:hypothetical protein
MKRILIDALVLEVTRAVNRDLCRRIGANYSSNPDRQRLVALLLALKETGRSVAMISAAIHVFCLGGMMTMKLLPRSPTK